MIGLKYPEIQGKYSIDRHYQGLHRLEKYLNIQDCLENYLKIYVALKTQRPWKVLEFYRLQEDTTLSLVTLISIKLCCLFLCSIYCTKLRHHNFILIF